LARGSRDHPLMMKKMKTLTPGTDSKSLAVTMKTGPGDMIVMTRKKKRRRARSAWCQDLLHRMMRTRTSSRESGRSSCKKRHSNILMMSRYRHYSMRLRGKRRLSLISSRSRG